MFTVERVTNGPRVNYLLKEFKLKIITRHWVYNLCGLFVCFFLFGLVYFVSLVLLLRLSFWFCERELKVGWVGELRIDQKRYFPEHIITTSLNIQNNNNKKNLLKTEKEINQVTYKSRTIKITPDFSVETLETRRAWINVLKALRDHRRQARLPYPAKLWVTRQRKT